MKTHAVLFAVFLIICATCLISVPVTAAPKTALSLDVPMYEYTNYYYSDGTYNEWVGQMTLTCGGDRYIDGERTSYFIVVYAAYCSGPPDIPTPIICPGESTCNRYYY
jgi:hypothetical protein